METATPAPPEIATRLEAARAALAELGADQTALEAGVEAAQAVAALTHDADLAVGTMLHRARQAGLALDNPQVESRLGPSCTRVAVELERLGELHLPADWSAGQGLNAQQAEILRKMLLALAADPRLGGNDWHWRRARSSRRLPIASASGA
jgi:(p)ppGpp synthase/HD superfamily hydrolase